MNGKKTVFKIVYQRKDKLFWFIPFWIFAGSELVHADNMKEAVTHANECTSINDWRIAKIKPIMED